MKVTKVDADSYKVENLNLAALNSIASALEADGLGERQVVIGKGFRTAYDKFSQPEPAAEVEETSPAE